MTFKGTISCAVSGVLRFAQVKHPKLGLEFTTKESVTLTLSVHLSGCKGTTSQAGATIVSGYAEGTVVGDFSCASMLNSVPSPTGKLAWTTKGNPAAPSTISLTAGVLKSGPPPTVSFKTTAKGSFAGSGKTTDAVVQTIGALVSSCKTSPYLTKVALNAKKSTFGV
ncbi:MAG: hypothetical protein ACRD0Z_17045 [Acidimicrobiales bacterium]